LVEVCIRYFFLAFFVKDALEFNFIQESGLLLKFIFFKVFDIEVERLFVTATKSSLAMLIVAVIAT
jgi:hypothetical protein